MTLEEPETLSSKFRKHEPNVDSAHWLPFAASKTVNISKCDVGGYFIVDEKPNDVLASAFRGRVLNGRVVDTDGFIIIADNPRQNVPGSVEINKLVVWNHDDVPLNSDVVPQAITLARLQHKLGCSD
jgi:hypothetical protein